MRRTGSAALLIGTALMGAALCGPAHAGWFWEDDGQDRGGWDQPRTHGFYRDRGPEDDGYARVPHRRVWVRRGDGWYADPYVEYEPDGGRYRYAPPESARPDPAPVRPRKAKRPVQAAPTEAEAVPSSRVTAAVPPAPNAWRPGALNVAPGQVKPGAASGTPVLPLGPASQPLAQPAGQAAKPVQPQPAAATTAPSGGQQVADVRSAKPAVAAAPVPVPRPNLEGLDFAPAASTPAAPAPAAAPVSAGVQREEDPR